MNRATTAQRPVDLSTALPARKGHEPKGNPMTTTTEAPPEVRPDDPCTYAAVHGWWGPDHKGTHCGDCHASWSGTGKAHCTVCHQTFASNPTADLHWHRERHVDPGLARNADGTPKLECDDDGVWHSTKRRPNYWERSA